MIHPIQEKDNYLAPENICSSQIRVHPVGHTGLLTQRTARKQKSQWTKTEIIASSLTKMMSRRKFQIGTSTPQ